MEVGDGALSAGDRHTARTAYENVLLLDPEHAAAVEPVGYFSGRPVIARAMTSR
jgi:hypothetical protein